MQTKYQQIIKDLIQKIENGQFPASHKLPSIRQLSQEYRCTKDTVQRALLELKHQHYVYPVPKSGYYVLGTPTLKEDLPLPQEGIQQIAYEDFLICLNETLIGRENYLFNYYHKQEGLTDLIQSIQRLLINYDVYTHSENIVITSGTQQALYILSHMDFPNGKTHILLEQPTYHRMNRLVKQSQLPYQTIERSLEGLDLAAVEKIFKEGKTKFFYTIPRIQTPLGVSYSNKEKKALIKLAQKYDVYIIEDDYMADFDEKNASPLHYLDTKGKVIYMKSFSTTLFPALRLGAVILPQPLIQDFLRYKSMIDYDTNLIMQKALSLYIDNGMFDKNKYQLQRSYSKTRETLETQLESLPIHFPYTIVGDHILFPLPSHRKRSALKYSDVTIDYLEDHYIAHCPYHYAKLEAKQAVIRKYLDFLTKEEAPQKK